MSGYTYLASPYSHPDLAVRAARYDTVLHCFVWMMRARIFTFAPIVECHHAAVIYGMPAEFDFWQDYNHAMLDGARSLCVLAIDGWKESRGVADELSHARLMGKGVSFARHRPDDSYSFTTNEELMR
jgi:hypothetical protein